MLEAANTVLSIFCSLVLVNMKGSLPKAGKGKEIKGETRKEIGIVKETGTEIGKGTRRGTGIGTGIEGTATGIEVTEGNEPGIEMMMISTAAGIMIGTSSKTIYSCLYMFYFRFVYLFI